MAPRRVARNAKASIQAGQVGGQLPSALDSAAVMEKRYEECRERIMRSQVWEATAKRCRCTEPADEIQLGGGLVDLWYKDDEDARVDPRLVLPYFRAIDLESESIGGE